MPLPAAHPFARDAVPRYSMRMNRTQKTPDHHDADLILKLYELRREPVMRQSRDAIVKWLPRTYEDVLAVTKPENQMNAAWRQVSSYFEMAYSFARQGVVNPDFLAENTGEGMIVFAKVQPYLDRLRKEVSPLMFANAEWLLANSDAAKQRFDLFTKRFQAMLAQK